MAHKTMVGGTNYDISGGICQVSGTDYSIINGRALVGGTGYDISFATLSGSVDAFAGMCRRIKHLNGYWVICGNTSSAGIVAYTTALDATWTVITIDSNIELTDIAYGNGYWAVSGHDDSSGKIWYTTSLSGTWTSKTIWDDYDYSYMNSIAYANGYWVVGGQHNIDADDYWATEARVAYATSLTGTWTTKVLASSATTSQLADIQFVDYINNTWVAVGTTRYGSTTWATNAVVFYATSPDQSTWSNCTAWAGGWTSVYSLVYANGYWAITGTYASSSGYPYARIAYATSLSGAWTTKNLWDTNDSSAAAYDIAYANGYWVVVGEYEESNTYYPVYCYATSLGGTWTTVNGMWGTMYGDAITSVTNYNGIWALGGHYRGYNAARILYAKGSPANLPTSV